METIKIEDMTNEDLNTAFIEFKAWEKSGVLHDGIIRKWWDAEDQRRQSGMVSPIEVQLVFLKEMARRFAAQH